MSGTAPLQNGIARELDGNPLENGGDRPASHNPPGNAVSN
jgi:hypothetical protein